MKITINGDTVAIDEGGTTTRTFTLEQYEKHSRDPDFAKAVPIAERAAVEVAIATARAAEDAKLAAAGVKRIA